MQNPAELWLLHSLAETYGQRPALLLGVSDEWAGYQLDVATLTIGRYVDAETADGKQQPRDVLRRLSAAAPAATPTTADNRHYRRLGGMPGLRKMHVPESGIW